MSRHLVARFRRAGAGADDGWRNSCLPHTAVHMADFQAHHGGNGTLDTNPDQSHTKLVNHGETRYGLQVHDTKDGWAEWSIHRQIGPDIDDPGHWERIGAPPESNPFCNCLDATHTDDDQDDVPLGKAAGVAGIASSSPGDPSGVLAAKAEVERAFQDYTGGLGHGLGGDGYDINQIMRDEGFR